MGTAEHEDLSRSLALIKDTIVQVDAQVNLHEKSSRLRDIHSKMEPKAQGKIKDGRVFRREDLAQGRRRLLHDGMVNWKAASGRLKGEPMFPDTLKFPDFNQSRLKPDHVCNIFPFRYSCCAPVRRPAPAAGERSEICVCCSGT